MYFLPGITAARSAYSFAVVFHACDMVMASQTGECLVDVVVDAGRIKSINESEGGREKADVELAKKKGKRLANEDHIEI